MLELTKQQARNFQIITLGLDNPQNKRPSKMDLQEQIRIMGVLQIDTVNVVARSPYLVLWSRLGNFPESWLEELFSDGYLFEYWSHAACFIPIEDFSLYRWKKDYYHGLWVEKETWIGIRPELSRKILNIIKENGQVKSADFNRTDEKHSTWWNWKDEKVALEQLFFTGALMVSHREKFQKVYNLTERVFPSWDKQSILSEDQSRIELTARTIKSLGVALTSWISDYYRFPKTGQAEILEKLLSDGKILSAKIEGLNEQGYIHQDNLTIFEAVAENMVTPNRTSILSPFDPLLWDRKRLSSLFDFNYQLEIYLPESKRKMGYFLLPILHKGSIIGQMDAKAHRKSRVFEVKSLYLENGVNIDNEFINSLSKVISEFAIWHNTPKIIFQNCEIHELKIKLMKKLDNNNDE